MIPELGYAATVAGFVLALSGAVAAVVGGWTGRAEWLRTGERAAIGVWVLITVCIALMLYAFLTFDFSVRYVAINTNRGTPFYYRITALWGALEGSIVLWSWMLSIYTLIVVVQYRRRQPELYPWVLSVMLGILAFFLLVMTIPAPPFERLTPIPPDGRGLNPLLEDSGMITHPVALYLGFTGFTVPFAFAMAALIIGRTGEEWITITRRWTIIAWYFLALGLLIGGWWSYHVLGWGGYWAWDPVENAAFMPWLTATAFLHSVMVQERRRMLKLWNLSLIILTFGLTLFGTFPVVSRESTFLLNNLFLLAATFTVFFGTVFPLLSEAVRGVKVSVGAPFFNLVNIPVFLTLLFLMGVGPLIAWRRASAQNLKRNFLKPVLAGIVAAAVLRLFGVANVLVLAAMGLVIFVSATIVLDYARAVRARRRSGEGWSAATWGLLLRQNRRYGGFIVHLGVLVVALGVAGSQAWSVQTETTLEKGQSVELGGYRVRFDGLEASEESNHGKVTGTFSVTSGRHWDVMLHPGRKFYPQEQTPIAAVDYRLGFIEDVYLVLGDFARDGSQATIKLQVNRMVSWLWLGGFVLTIGAALAILPDHRKPA